MKILIKYSIIRSICKVKLFFDEVENHELSRTIINLFEFCSKEEGNINR